MQYVGKKINMSKVFIIAEAGVNHNGSMELARKLCDAAKQSGADAVKFQTFKTERIIVRNAGLAEYQKRNLTQSRTQFEMLKELELSYADFKKIKDYCDKIAIEFISTPDEEESLDFLVSLGIGKIKVGSGEINNLPYLRKIGALQGKVIISTGMATLGEIEAALDVLIKEGTKKENIIVLHCNTEYPTPVKDVNLSAMLTIKDAFKVNVGYSDHTAGIEVPIAAAALGASVIEKHFTLDRTMPGPDHKASLEPDELKAMVRAIRNIEKAMGTGIKRASPSELKNKPIARKSIVAACHIKKGEVLTERNLTTKRPGTGISPMQWDEVIGKAAKRNFAMDELIEL